MDNMTLDALGIALAKAEGWRVEPLTPFTSYWTYTVYHHDRAITTVLISSPSTEPSNAYVWKRAFKEAHIPDYPRDTGAALALCLEIARGRGWHLVIGSVADISIHVVFQEDFRGNGEGGKWTGFAETSATPAEALARLAWAALKGSEIRGDVT